MSSKIERNIEIQVRRPLKATQANERSFQTGASHSRGGLRYAGSLQAGSGILKGEACVVAHCPSLV